MRVIRKPHNGEKVEITDNCMGATLGLPSNEYVFSQFEEFSYVCKIHPNLTIEEAKTYIDKLLEVDIDWEFSNIELKGRTVILTYKNPPKENMLKIYMFISLVRYLEELPSAILNFWRILKFAPLDIAVSLSAWGTLTDHVVPPPKYMFSTLKDFSVKNLLNRPYIRNTSFWGLWSNWIGLRMDSGYTAMPEVFDEHTYKFLLNNPSREFNMSTYEQYQKERIKTGGKSYTAVSAF